ncbi:MAG: Fur family transcriptional regulator [Chloroflexi bacterium]|nr:Fur family transcriptional regulator [Chloroflexota bacterium]MDA1239288.1 Fur family transcriptional regulator [Chloroflexota bacterium]
MTTAEAIEQTLARRGYRLTGPRRALLEVMSGLGDHFAADDVVNAAPAVGRATVFRTLKLLQDLDVVCQVVLEDGATAYRLAPDEHHHHLLCVECSEMRDFSSDDLEAVIAEVARRTGFTVEAHRFEVYGRCPACQARTS